MNEEKEYTKKNHNILKIFLILFVIVLILGTAVFSAYLVKSNGNMVDAAIEIATDVVGKQDPIFCLILGISDDISVCLTDTIILAGYNPEKQKAFMVSIPRDTYVGNNEAKANGNNKINSLYQKDVSKTIDAVEKLTGVKIDYYIAIKTKALRELVDSIGGIEYNVPIDMNYDDITQNLHIHLKEGNQILNGKQSEQLVRFRHNNNGTTYPKKYGDNDFGRMRTQRDFIKCLAKKIISFENISKINEIATAIFNNIETNISLSKIFSYIPYSIKFDMDNLRLAQLPGESKLINELWFFKSNKIKTEELFKEILFDFE